MVVRVPVRMLGQVLGQVLGRPLGQVLGRPLRQLVAAVHCSLQVVRRKVRRGLGGAAGWPSMYCCLVLQTNEKRLLGEFFVPPSK